MPNTTRTYGAFKPLRTFRSRTQLGAFLEAAHADHPVAQVARVPEIPSPYAYSPEWPVYGWDGHLVFVRETSHNRYDVFEVAPDQVLYDEEGRVLALG